MRCGICASEKQNRDLAARKPDFCFIKFPCAELDGMRLTAIFYLENLCKVLKKILSLSYVHVILKEETHQHVGKARSHSMVTGPAEIIHERKDSEHHPRVSFKFRSRCLHCIITTMNL